jgi:hypothetical protein
VIACAVVGEADVVVAAGLANDSPEQFQIDITSTDDRDHPLSYESIFSLEETPNA